MLSDRLKKALDESKLTQADLARACRVKPPSVSGWLSGKSKFLRGENLLSAAKALGVNEEWLATGKGSMKVDIEASYSSGVTTLVECKEPEYRLSTEEQSLIQFYRKLGKEGRALILSMVSESEKIEAANESNGGIRRTRLKIPHDKPGEREPADPRRPGDHQEKPQQNKV